MGQTMTTSELLDLRRSILTGLWAAEDADPDLQGMEVKDAAAQAVAQLASLLIEWPDNISDLETGRTYRYLGDALFSQSAKQEQVVLYNAVTAYLRAEPYLKAAGSAVELAKMRFNMANSLRLIHEGLLFPYLESAESLYSEAAATFQVELPELMPRAEEASQSLRVMIYSQNLFRPADETAGQMPLADHDQQAADYLPGLVLSQTDEGLPFEALDDRQQKLGRSDEPFEESELATPPTDPNKAKPSPDLGAGEKEAIPLPYPDAGDVPDPEPAITLDNLRLDSRLPESVRMGDFFYVAAAVRQPQSPLLEEADLLKAKSGLVQVQRRDDSSMMLEIKISAPTCTQLGEDHYRFTLIPGRESPIFYFQMMPDRTGFVPIMITVYQQDFWLGSTRLQTLAAADIEEKPVGQVSTSVFSQEDPKSLSETMTNRLRQLRDEIQASFGLEDLRNLCFDMGLNYENFPSVLSGFVRELIRYCQRSGRLAELLGLCNLYRPHLKWPIVA